MRKTETVFIAIGCCMCILHLFCTGYLALGKRCRGIGGTCKDKLMNTATFVDYLKATFTSGELINKKRNISLIR